MGSKRDSLGDRMKGYENVTRTKLVISYNGVPTNNFFARVLGALIISLILTLFIGLPIIGVISLFI